MLTDGTYVRDPDGGETSSQEALYRYFSTRKVSLKGPPAMPEGSAQEEEAPRKGGLRGLLSRLFG